MPSKKNKKPVRVKQDFNAEMDKEDRNKFLSAYEQVTQIYRFISIRSKFSPAFLPRTLTYHQATRMSRLNNRRQFCKVDSLLGDNKGCKSISNSFLHTINSHTVSKVNSTKAAEMKISIVGFFVDPGNEGYNLFSTKYKSVRIKLEVVRTTTKRRKGAKVCTLKHNVGVASVWVNPRNAENYAQEEFTVNLHELHLKGLQSESNCEGEDLTFTPPAEGHNFRNYALRFSIYKPDDDATDEEDEDDDVSDCDVSVGSSGTFVTPPNNTETGSSKRDHTDINPMNMQQGVRKRKKAPGKYKQFSSVSSIKSESRSQASKYRKINPTSISINKMDKPIYETEMQVFDKNGKPKLQAGYYDISLPKSNEEAIVKTNKTCIEQEINGKSMKKSNDNLLHSNGLNSQPIWERIGGGKEIEMLSQMCHSPKISFNINWEEQTNGHSSPSKSPTHLNGLMDQQQRTKITMINQEEEEESDAKYEQNHNGFSENETIEEKPRIFDLISYKKPSASFRLGNGDKKPCVKVYMQFVYNQMTQQQTQLLEDLQCPWCKIRCHDIKAFVMHQHLCHPRLKFKLHLHPDCVTSNVISDDDSLYPPTNQPLKYIMEVNLNECYDHSFHGNPAFMYALPDLCSGRMGPIKRVTSATVTMATRRKRVAGQQMMDALDALELSDTIAEFCDGRGHGGRRGNTGNNNIYDDRHNRLYFHSTSQLPVRPANLSDDSEEECEGATQWLNEHMGKLMDEFTDVNEGEKVMMKLWNCFMLNNPCTADAQMPLLLIKFVEEHYNEIYLLNIPVNFQLFVSSFVDFQVIKSSICVHVIRRYHDLVKRNKTKLMREPFTKPSYCHSKSIDKLKQITRQKVCSGKSSEL